MRLSRSRSLLFSLATVIVLSLIVELALRVVTWQTTRFLADQDKVKYEYRLWQLHLFDSFMGMHQPDPELFWKLKSNFSSSLLKTNSSGFAGPEIDTKTENEFRILFLGDSTPLGIGLEHFSESFPFQLETMLNCAKSGKKVCVINTATAGYSSWQCWKLLELEGKRLQPDMVITYFGNNDPSINGFLSDRELYEISAGYGSVKRLLGKSYLYQLLKSVLLRLKSGNGDADLKARVKVADFERNLESIYSWCRQNGCILIPCTIPTPVLWPPGIQFKVFIEGRDKSGRLIMADEMRKEIGIQWSLCLDTLLLPGKNDLWVQKVYSSSYTDVEDPVLVEGFYRQQLELEKDNAQYLNNLGVILWRQGKDPQPWLERALSVDSLNPTVLYNLGIVNNNTNPQIAKEFLTRARDLDRHSLRIKSAYNQAIRHFATRNNLLFIDLEYVFENLTESEYFVDHCHPTQKGHKLVAAKLFESLGSFTQ